MIDCVETLESFVNDTGLRCVLFVGPRHAPSEVMAEVLTNLAEEFGRADAYFETANVSQLLSSRTGLAIDQIPLLWLCYQGHLVKAVVGANPPAAFQAVNEISSLIKDKPDAVLSSAKSLKADFAKAKDAVNSRVRAILEEHRLIAVGADASTRLQARGLSAFETLMPLEDRELAGGLKALFPDQEQSDFVILDKTVCSQTEVETEAGLAKLKEADEAMRQQLNTRLADLIKRAPVMLFMKGTKSQPFCKYSRAMVALLNEHQIDFDYFNIFEDQRVREGLKTYSKWPTYPQLYVNGELQGGLDILNQMLASGVTDLKKELGIST